MNKLSLFKIVWLLCVFIPATTTCFAQTSEFRKLSFGLRGGYSTSGFTNHYEIYTQKKAGFTIGAFTELRPISLIGIETGVNYLQEGAFHVNANSVYPSAYISGIGLSLSTIDVRFNTIQVPLLINVRPAPGAVQPRITAGWSFDYIANVTSKDNSYSINSYPMEDRNKQNVSQNFKKFNTGPILGLGLDFDGSNYKYLIDVRCKIGLNDISNIGGLQSINKVYPFSITTWTATFGIALK